MSSKTSPSSTPSRELIGSKLEREALQHEFFDEGEKSYLIFRVDDAPEVARCFDELATETTRACKKAEQQLSKEKGRAAARDGETLDDPDKEPLQGQSSRPSGNRQSSRNAPMAAAARSSTKRGDVDALRQTYRGDSRPHLSLRSPRRLPLRGEPPRPSGRLPDPMEALLQLPAWLAGGGVMHANALAPLAGMLAACAIWGIWVHQALRGGAAPARRGARLLPLGQHRRGQSVHEPGRPGPEHPADKLHRDPRLQVRLRPGNGPQPQHLRRRNTRNGQDQEPRASAADADERQLPGNRPEGNAHRIHRVDVRGRRLQDPATSTSSGWRPRAITTPWHTCAPTWTCWPSWSASSPTPPETPSTRETRSGRTRSVSSTRRSSRT